MSGNFSRNTRCSNIGRSDYRRELLVRILLDAERTRPVLDLLETHYTGDEGNRVVILPVEATCRAQSRSLPPHPKNHSPRKNHRSGWAGRSCTRTSRMPHSVRVDIWR